MKEYSKAIIWRAVNSEYGSRLVEIAREHTMLANELLGLINQGAWLVGANPEILKARITLLREERNAILEQFESEAEPDD